MNFNWKYKRCTTYMEKPKERKRFLQHSKRWDMLNISEKIVLAIWQSAHSTLSRFIYCSKISLEPGKEPEETHSLLHGALSILVLEYFRALVLLTIFRCRLERIRKAFQDKWKFELTTWILCYSNIWRQPDH